MITRRENLRRVLRGQSPKWVPCSLNLMQWFKHHKNFNTLPDELRACNDHIDAMKVLGCDIFSRNLDGGYREKDTLIEKTTLSEPSSTGPRVTHEYKTPHGALRSIIQFQTAASTQHHEEYFVKDWERDGQALRWLLEQRNHSWDEAAFDKMDQRIGDDGIVNVPVACTPLKMLHWNLGLEYTCLFVTDFPEAAKELCALYWDKVRPVLKVLADHPRVESAILMDNVDAPFYPPCLAEQYWAPFVAEAAAILRSAGKTLWVHACGKLAVLGPIFARTKVSGLEGIAHPPLGDWPAKEAQTCHDRFIFNGGFSAREQELMDDDDVRAFYANYLPTASRDRFIFAASCQTTVNTRWPRIKLARDICRQWGGRPDEYGRR